MVKSKLNKTVESCVFLLAANVVNEEETAVASAGCQNTWENVSSPTDQEEQVVQRGR